MWPMLQGRCVACMPTRRGTRTVSMGRPPTLALAGMHPPRRAGAPGRSSGGGGRGHTSSTGTRIPLPPSSPRRARRAGLARRLKKITSVNITLNIMADLDITETAGEGGGGGGQRRRRGRGWRGARERKRERETAKERKIKSDRKIETETETS